MFEKYREWTDKARDHDIIAGKALLILGDSAQILANTSLSADAAIMDPPYDFESDGGARLFNREKKSAFHDLRERGLTNGFDPIILEKAALADSLAVFFHNDQLYEMLGVLTEPRRISVPYNEENGDYYSKEIEPIYDRFALCGWNKTNPMPVANKHYVPDTELYIHAWRGEGYPKGELMEKRRFFFSEPIQKSKYGHPTIKPQSVMRKVVENASKGGDIVLDPFMGSGSTGIAALSLGRFFIGIEIDPEFYEMARERISAAALVPYESSDGTMTLF